MDIEALKEFLIDNLSIEVEFDRYRYDGNNILRVSLKLDGETIAKSETIVEPDMEKPY